MTRRQFAAALSAASLAAAPAPRPNVLFLIADDCNDSLGCYGNPIVKTPHLDALARRATVFENAYCQFPLCQPSRTSLLSGLRPETTRVWTLATPTRQHIGDAALLPELFRRHGYFTAHAGKVFHTGPHAEDPRSWDEEKREFGKNPPRSEVLRSADDPEPSGHSFRWDVLRTADADTPDGIQARQTVTWLEQRAEDRRPFFLAAGFRRPHAPYAAPAPYFDLYPPDQMPLPRPDPPPDVPAAANHPHPVRPLAPRVVREHLAAYYACVSFVDAQVGLILNALDRLNLRRNTIIVFLGDHGYHLGNHGGLWHKQTLFESAARAPLLLAAPGMAPGRCPRLVEFVDIYPTLAELCGLPAPANLEGLSAVPLLRRPARAWKTAAFSMVGRSEKPGENAKDVAFTGRTIRTEQWRYTEWDDTHRGVELYDVRQDPSEIRNLAASSALAPVRADLARRLRAGWRAALPTTKK
jgi:iduronate 2-sulfatase